jgi:23S rRNA (cytosine1962-C5)-methyltransferase
LRLNSKTEARLKKLTPSKQMLARLRLRVTTAAESRLRSGHPWLFADSVLEQNRPGHVGELAVIYDRKDRFLAVGLFDPDSPIRVRVLHAGKPQNIDSNWWRKRLEYALQRRQGLFDEQTDGFRWIHGESDGWPALVLDQYASTLVLKLYSAIWLMRLQELSSLLRDRLVPQRLVLRLSRNLIDATKGESSVNDGQILQGNALARPVQFLESGLRFEADVLRGQKTGFFLDQRENRGEVQKLSAGRRVLNAFSFSGAFSVYAASGGASAATDLDISAHALATAKQNFALNRESATITACTHELIQADAFDWLAQNSERKFGMVILDPPSLAKRESERAGAIRAYTRLTSAGINHLVPGGILLACSCSAHVSQAEFFGAVRQAATKSHRRFEELQTTEHPPDHPAGFEEAKYLKAIYLRFQHGASRG